MNPQKVRLGAKLYKSGYNRAKSVASLGVQVAKAFGRNVVGSDVRKLEASWKKPKKY